jgi:hypothetical protein
VLIETSGVQIGCWRAAEIPAINGHATARAVAGFYHELMAGGVLGTAMLAEAVTPQCTGRDRVFGDQNAWGLGFGLSADGYGFVTGGVAGFDRVDALENALRSCLGLPAVPGDG